MDELYSIDEEKITGQRVVSTNEFKRVKMHKRRVDSDHTEYFVNGSAPLNHEALARVLSAPFGIQDPSIQEVQKNLSEMSYPSRSMRLLAKRAGIAGYLDEIKSPAGELAAVMTSASDEPFASTALPVFTYGEARNYVFEQLQQMELRPLIRNLRRFGLSKQAKEWFELMASLGDTPDGSFDEVFGDPAKQHELLKSILLTAKIDPNDRSLVDFIDHQQEQWFTGFVNRNAYIPQDSGTDNLEKNIYMRTEDAPTKSTDNTTVLLGSELMEPYRKTGLPQRRVQFFNEQHEIFATRQLAWIHNNDTNDRTFLVRGSELESVHSRVVRPSSLVGMAAAAIKFGDPSEYVATLEEVIKKGGYRFRHLSRAGLWPLVATHNQEEILSHSYFKLVEEKLDY